MNTLDQYFHNVYSEQILSDLLYQPKLRSRLIQERLSLPYYVCGWSYPSVQRMAQYIMQLSIKNENIQKYKMMYPQVESWTATTFLHDFLDRTCLQLPIESDGYVTMPSQECRIDLNMKQLNANGLFAHWFKHLYHVMKSTCRCIINICTPENRKYWMNLMVEYCGELFMYYREMYEIDPYIEMHFRLASYLVTNLESSPERKWWHILQPRHGEMIIPPFSHSNPTKSAYWFGPPIDGGQFYGPKSHLQPGIADPETIKGRVIHFIGDIAFHFIKDMYNPNMIPHVTGSIIPACLVRHVPVPGLTWPEYIQQEYAHSDVDLLCSTPNVKEYMRWLARQYERADAMGAEIHIKQKLVGRLDITDDIRPLILAEYYVHRQYSPEDLANNVIIRKLNDRLCETHLIGLSADDMEWNYDEDYLTTSFPFDYNGTQFGVSLRETVQIQIKFPGCRPIEIFHTVANALTKIQSFHLPCVRGYFSIFSTRSMPTYVQGYMHPSLINALMTGCNQDCQVLLSNKCHPAEVIHKYHRRGFGTLLNRTENEQYQQVLREKGLVSPTWSYIPAPGDIEYNPSLYRWTDGHPVYSWCESI